MEGKNCASPEKETLGQANTEMDIVGMMEMAKKMNAMMSLFGGNNQEETPRPDVTTAESDKVEVLDGGPEKVIHAAIPFLDQEYQKSLYLIVRLLEMKKIMGQTDGMLESRSRGVKAIDPAQRRSQLLQAVRPHLDPNIRTRVDKMAKFIEIHQIMERREQ